MHLPRDRKVKDQGHTVAKTVTVAQLLVTRAASYGRVLLLPTWVCMSIRPPMFYTSTVKSINEWPIITNAGKPPAWVGRSVMYDYICLSVCPRSRKKTAWAINTKLGTHIPHILYSSRSACTDPRVKRLKFKVTRLRKPSTTSPLLICLLVRALKIKRRGAGIFYWYWEIVWHHLLCMLNESN